MLREIWDTLVSSLRDFGAMTIFFMWLLAYTPGVFLKRFRLVVYGAHF